MKKAILLFMLSALVLLTACSSGEDERQVLYSFTDSLGRQVEVYSFEKTAVLSGSLAEIWQLAGGELYGTTNDAYDRNVLSLSGEEKNYGGVQNPSTERIIADGVDFVILSGSIANHVKLCDMLESAGVTAAYFDVENFEDYLDALRICTEITGREDLYIKNGENIRAEVEAAKQSAKQHSAPKILLLRAISTGMKAKGSDSMTGQMLKELGCVNIADSETSLLESLSLEAVVRANPDYVFITTIGDSESGLAQYEAELMSNPAWLELDAVKGGRVHILPKELYHHKPNVRWAEAYRNLEKILYETE